jgi:hypothetical protein
MPGVGAIHVSEIEPTLRKLEKELGINLRDFTLGSVGKKQFSGDIDVAINLKPEELEDFGKKLQAAPSVEDYKKSSVFMTRVAIENYDDSKKIAGKERTGYVQVDFMPGDPGWMKTYYHAPHEKGMSDDGRFSKYKGTFRNIMIATIAGRLDVKSSDEKLPDGRPLEQERWIWSPADGLVRIKRQPKPRKDGNGYTKAKIDTIIGKPIKDAEGIAKQLGLSGGEDLYSFETLLDAIKKAYTPDQVNTIIGDFKENPVVQDIGIPDEIS